MEGIKYMNLIKLGLVVIETRWAEIGELEVLVNNILVRHTAFLATDTRSCVLILITWLIIVYRILYIHGIILGGYNTSKCTNLNQLDVKILMNELHDTVYGKTSTGESCAF